MKKYYLLLYAFFAIGQIQTNTFYKSSSASAAKAGTSFTVLPIFDPVAAICSGQPLSPLPTTSLNGITGIWTPAINNTTTTTYTFTPNPGQDATMTTLTITVNSIPAPPIVTPMHPTCSVATGTILINGVAGQTYSVDNSPYAGSLTYSGLAAGSVHMVTAKNAAGCISAVTIVTINSQPTTPAAPSASVTYQSCSSATINITSAPGETFSFDGAAYAATQSYSGLTPGSSHTITTRNAAGCISPIRNITIDTFIAPNFAAIAPICSGSSVPVLSTTAPNGITGTWSPPTISSTASQNYVFTPSAGFSGCAATQVLSTAIVAAVFAGTDGGTTICDANTSIINLYSLITGEQSGGIWTRISGTGGIFNAAAGTYMAAPGATPSIFVYTIFGTAPCPDDSSIAIINVNPQPNAGTDGLITICENDTSPINLFNIITGEGPGGTWTQLSGSGGTFNPTMGTFSPQQGATTSVFSYTITGTAPCLMDSSFATITINQAPQAGAITGNPNICVGLTTAFSSTAIGGTWSSSNNSVATVNPITGVVIGISAGVTTITYTISATPPCAAGTASRLVTVNPDSLLVLMSALPTANQTVCMNSPILPIAYTVGNGATAASITAGSLPPGITATFSSGILTISGTPTQSGTFNYTVTASGGCSTPSLSGVITVNNLLIFCGSNTPNSVYFDWANVMGFSSYNYTYSINGGPLVSGNTVVSHLEVFGVLPGDSVTFTITNVVGVSCVPPTAATCNLPLANTDFENDPFEYFPNPVDDVLNLKYAQPITDIMVFNAIGQLVHTQSSGAKTARIDMSGYTNGIYMVKVAAGNLAKTFKVIKN